MTRLDNGPQVALTEHGATLWGVRTATVDTSTRSVWVRFDPAPEGLCIPWLNERGLLGCTNIRNGVCFFQNAPLRAVLDGLRPLVDLVIRSGDLATINAQVSVWAAFRILAGAPVATYGELLAYEAGRAAAAGETERQLQRARADGTAWAASEIGRLAGRVEELVSTVERQRVELARRPVQVDGYDRAARQREADATLVETLSVRWAAEAERLAFAGDERASRIRESWAAAARTLVIEIREGSVVP